MSITIAVGISGAHGWAGGGGLVSATIAERGFIKAAGIDCYCAGAGAVVCYIGIRTTLIGGTSRVFSSALTSGGVITCGRCAVRARTIRCGRAAVARRTAKSILAMSARAL